MTTPRPRRWAPLLRTLLDPHLRTPLTPVLMPALYAGLVVTAVAAGVVAVVVAALYAWWLGLLALVLAPMGVLGAVVAARIGCELVLTFAALAERADHMAADLSGVAEDMPPLRFLRLRR